MPSYVRGDTDDELLRLGDGARISRFIPNFTKPTRDNTGNRLPILHTTTGEITLTSSGVMERTEHHGRIVMPQSSTGVVKLKNGVIDVSDLDITDQNEIVDKHVNSDAQLILENMTIIGRSGLMGIGVRRFIARRCKFINCEDGVRLHNVGGTSDPNLNVEISECYIGDLVMRTPDPFLARDDLKTHSDCIQIEGGRGANIHGNTLYAFASTDGTSNVQWATTAPPFTAVAAGTSGAAPFTQATSALMLTRSGSASPIEDLIFDYNWVDGGEIPVNAGSSSNSTTTGRMNYNRFGRGAFRGSNLSIGIDVSDNTEPYRIATVGNVWEDTGLPVSPLRNQ